MIVGSCGMDWMFRKLLLAAAVSLSTTPVAAAQQQPPTAADFAENMQGAIGQTFEGGIVLKNITHEENTLVFIVDGPVGWRQGLTPDDISNALIGGFCSTAPAFFTVGVTVRVDSLDNGLALNGPIVTECPIAKNPASPGSN